MSQPTLDERKTYWKWAYAIECLTLVKSSIENIDQNPISNTGVKFILFAGIIATYSKPFTKCHGVGCLDEKIIPHEFREKHDKVLNLRHRAVAHIDAVNFRLADSSYGNIHRVVINIGKEKFGYTTYLINAYETLKNPIRDLCCIILEKGNYYTNRFEEKHIAKSKLKRGDYLLNIDPQDERAFIPLESNFVTNIK